MLATESRCPTVMELHFSLFVFCFVSCAYGSCPCGLSTSFCLLEENIMEDNLEEWTLCFSSSFGADLVLEALPLTHTLLLCDETTFSVESDLILPRTPVLNNTARISRTLNSETDTLTQ